VKTLLLAVAALFASVLLTQMILEDPGYLFLAYDDWTVETSLAVAVLLLAAAYVLLRLFIHLLGRLMSAPVRLQDWERRRSRRRARRALLQGLMDLAEGNWRGAERNLLRFVEDSEMPLLNYLSAARAAQQLEAYDRRDRYLQLAHESMPVAEVAVGLTQAELQLAHQQDEQALATLMRLRQLVPRHTYVLRLLRTLYERLGDWQNLRELLPELRRHRIGDLPELEALDLRVQQGLLTHLAKREDPAALTAHWQGLPRSLRACPPMVEVYAAALIERGDESGAERVLRACLEESWSPVLVERYGELRLEDSREQLTVAESWLAGHSGDPALLLTLGRLCQRCRLWGKARSYFEACIGAGGRLRPVAYRELGVLLEQMGETQRALECYRDGLKISTGDAAVADGRGANGGRVVSLPGGGGRERSDGGALAASPPA
jgi:HemY protein